MKPYKRPEKELDHAKAPGQIIYRTPHDCLCTSECGGKKYAEQRKERCRLATPHFEQPVVKAVEEYKRYDPAKCTCRGKDGCSNCMGGG